MLEAFQGWGVLGSLLHGLVFFFCFFSVSCVYFCNHKITITTASLKTKSVLFVGTNSEISLVGYYVA